MRSVCVQAFQLLSRFAVFLLLLAHVLPFTMLLGSMLQLFLQLSGQILLSVTRRLIPLAEMLRFILLAQVGMLSF